MKPHENQFPKHLWEGVKERFTNAKTVQDYNKIRQNLIDEWTVEYADKTYTATINGKTQKLPYYILLTYYLDTSGLIVQLNLQKDENNTSNN
jgi:hypothetical protein